MQVDEVIRSLIERSGESARTISKRLGRATSWASMVGRSGRDPSLGTITRVADVAGYDIAIIDRATGETVATIDPPRREG